MRILILDDEASIRSTLAVMLRGLEHEVVGVADAAAALRELERAQFDLCFLDLKLEGENGLEVLPRLRRSNANLDVVVFTAYASIDNAVEAMRRGAKDYIAKPFTPEQIRQLLRKIGEARSLSGRIANLEAQLTGDAPPTVMESVEPAMERVFSQAFRAANSAATVLLLGESGTGKSILARAMHERSPFRDRPFVTINCPSLSAELLESELFGRVKGAYTGASSDTWGKVALADGGTLFLDEIGELPVAIQPKLLRLLQEKEYERVGEAKTRRANVRVIAATNRNLEAAVQEKTFREDLFYRLNVIGIRMPPLRERPRDLKVLATGCLKFFGAQCGKPVTGLSSAAWQTLETYPWPGNLRELRNAIEHAVIFANGREIVPADLPDQLGPRPPGAPAGVSVGMKVSLEQIETEHIRRVLAQTRTMEEAAQLLGISRGTLYERKKKMGI
ncbi:MAG TPA: sigma-54 dependent transcriptional regulator [Verrucomicrobiota bacterium]|nr:sigma-54 dependent transcriptional regulator [Verrucomicrobiota bacterium]HNT14866.1 sigma-54 dependent transcriptional regulator [Verrucomicrobiota bacterium]